MSEYQYRGFVARDLRNLATQQATAPEFARRFEALCKRQPRRRGFVDRWKRAGAPDAGEG